MPDIPKGAHGNRELDVCGTFCPVPRDEVAERCREILVRMIPAVLEEDLESFGTAVNRVQELGFKKVEEGLQHPLIRSLMEEKRSAGAVGAGLSSFGPTVYAIVDSGTRDIQAAAMEVMRDVGGEVVVTRPRNSGARTRSA
jgi:beta-ribofuranosylaminobenzene 5'-phosphate synthase